MQVLTVGFALAGKFEISAALFAEELSLLIVVLGIIDTGIMTVRMLPGPPHTRSGKHCFGEGGPRLLRHAGCGQHELLRRCSSSCR